MFVIKYRLGSFVRSERIEDRDAAFERARAIWSTDGCEYVFVRDADGDEVSVKRTARDSWPGRPDRRRRPR